MDKIKAFFGMGAVRRKPRRKSPTACPQRRNCWAKCARALTLPATARWTEKQAKANGETDAHPEYWGHGPTDARTIAGILYELYYRARINSWPPYTFATDVSIDFITRVKELNLPGVEIETTSVRKYNTEYAAHLLGYTGAITSETWPTYKEKAGTL